MGRSFARRAYGGDEEENGWGDAAGRMTPSPKTLGLSEPCEAGPHVFRPGSVTNVEGVESGDGTVRRVCATRAARSQGGRAALHCPKAHAASQGSTPKDGLHAREAPHEVGSSISRRKDAGRTTCGSCRTRPRPHGLRWPAAGLPGSRSPGCAPREERSACPGCPR